MEPRLAVGIQPRGPRQHEGESEVPEWMADASPRRWARIAGVLYLIVIVGGFFAIGYVPAAIVVPGNAGATARNILAQEQLYRLGLAIHGIILACNMPLAVIFYDLFKVVSRRVSMLVVFFTLMGTAIEGANLLSQFTPLILLRGGQYSSLFNGEQLQALAYLPLDLQAVSFSIQQVFYAFYCLSIGYAIVRATFFPRAVGVLMAIAGLCYLTNSFATFVAPGFAASLYPYILVPSFVGEVSLCLSLLVVGVNVRRWQEQAGAAGEAVRP